LTPPRIPWGFTTVATLRRDVADIGSALVVFDELDAGIDTLTATGSTNNDTNGTNQSPLLANDSAAISGSYVDVNEQLAVVPLLRHVDGIRVLHERLGDELDVLGNAMTHDEKAPQTGIVPLNLTRTLREDQDNAHAHEEPRACN
jgi:hypothetical protein